MRSTAVRAAVYLVAALSSVVLVAVLFDNPIVVGAAGGVVGVAWLAWWRRGSGGEGRVHRPEDVR